MDLELDIDPDNNLFSNINNNCCYNSAEQYNQTIQTDSKANFL